MRIVFISILASALVFAADESFAGSAQGSLLWATRAGGAGSDSAWGTASIPSGSTLVTGTFGGTATFGAGESNETMLTAGTSDVFVAKYDRSGTLVWAIRVGSVENYNANAIAAQGDGSFFVGGNFSGSSTIGPGDPNETTLVTAGMNDILLAKYSSTGSLLWAKSAGGTGLDVSGDVVGLPDGGAILVGTFDDPVTFGSGEINETVLGASGITAFLARYDSAGALQWAKQVDSSNLSAGRSTDILSDGSMILSGTFSGTATFGFGEANETTLVSAGLGDVFVAWYDAHDGELIRVKTAPSSGADSALAVAGLPDGGALVTGTISAAATFGPGEANETILPNSGGFDFFIARYNSDGTLAWARHAGGSGLDVGNGIAARSDDSAIVTGSFESVVTLGSGEANETTLTSQGGNDLFVALYNPDGTLGWALSEGAGGVDAGHSVSDPSYGHPVVAGHFSNAPTFGLGESGETTLTSAGSHDIFVATYFALPNAVPAIGEFGRAILSATLMMLGVRRCRLSPGA